MEEFIIVVFAGLMIVAWGFGLIGVPMLFRRVKKLEQQLQEVNLNQPSAVEYERSATEQDVDPTSDAELNADAIANDTPVDDYEVQLANAYQAITKTVQEESTTDAVLPVAEDPVETEPAPQPSANTPSWLERQLSTNLTAKIGAIVLIFGAVFLAKYAADIGVFTITARLWVMGLSGIVMTILGWRIAESRQLYADILQGTGFAIWLATWFATHVLYNQVGWVATLIACVLGVVFIGYRAITQNSQVLAFIGLLGGFVAPFIASSEANSLWRLFGYMLVMNIAVAVITVNKPWRWFLRLGYLGSFLLLSLLMTAEYLQGDLGALNIQAPMMTFVAGLVIIYSLLASRWLHGADPVYQRVLSGLLISVPSMAALAVYGLFKEQSIATASVFLVTGFWYAILWFKVRQWPLLATAIVAASIAIPFALNDSLSSLIYSIEGAAFFAYAVRQQRWVYVAWAGAIQLAAAAFALYVFTDYSVFSNSLYLTWPLFSAIVLAGLFSAWVLSKSDSFGRFNTVMQKVLIAWSIFWWLYMWVFYCAEVLAREHFFLLCIVLMPVTLLLLEAVNHKLRWPNLVYFQPIFSLIILITGIVYNLNYDWSGAMSTKLLIVLMLAIQFVARIYFNRKRSSLWMGESVLIWFGFTWLMGLLLSHLNNLNTDWSVVGFLLPIVIVFSLHKVLIPTLFETIEGQTWVLRLSIVAVLLSSSLTMASLGNYAPWPFMLLIHPMSLLVIIMGYVLFKLRHQERLVIVPSVVWAAIMVTLEANRFLFHYLGINYDIDAWLSSAITQTVWSLMWSAMGATLMVVGSRLHISRRIWISGAIALGIVVVKLFLLDLSNVDTLNRILSFIGVGALLLVVGYFAPLPQETHNDEAVTL